MEQYELAQETVYKDLKYCLKNYKAKSIFIRLVGFRGGTIKVNETIENKTLNIKKVPKGLSILIGGSKVFLYKQDKTWGQSFSLAYERIKDGRYGKLVVMLPEGINPEDPNLPPVNTSFFRSVNFDHLLEIYFEGKIPLKFHSWWDKEKNWKYWRVARKK